MRKSQSFAIPALVLVLTGGVACGSTDPTAGSEQTKSASSPDLSFSPLPGIHIAPLPTNAIPCGEQGGACCTNADMTNAPPAPDGFVSVDFYTECNAQTRPVQLESGCFCGASCGDQGVLACAAAGQTGLLLTYRMHCNPGLVSVCDPTTQECGICQPCGIYNVSIYDVDTAPWPTDTTICFQVTALAPVIPYGVLVEDANGQVVNFTQEVNWDAATAAGHKQCMFGLSPSTTYTVQFVPGGLPAWVNGSSPDNAGSTCDPASEWITWQRTTTAPVPPPPP